MTFKFLCRILHLSIVLLLILNGSYSSSAEYNFYRKRWAVIIGINDYKNWPKLVDAVNDARSVKGRLEKRGFEIIYLENQAATRDRITRVLWDELPGKLEWDDLVLVFFSGHSDTEIIDDTTEMGYMIPVDAMPQVWSTAISVEWIRQLSRKLKAKHIYYVFNAGYSSLIFQDSSLINLLANLDSKNLSAPVETNFLNNITEKRSVQMITAGSRGENIVRESSYSLFTKYFLEALDGKADLLPTDEVVTSTELGIYLRLIVSIASNNKQTPLFGPLEGKGDIAFEVSRQVPVPTSPSVATSSLPASTSGFSFVEEDLVQKLFNYYWKNVRTYEDLVNTKKPELKNDQIIQLLVEIIIALEKIKEIGEILPKNPEMDERLSRLSDLIVKFKKKLSDNLHNK